MANPQLQMTDVPADRALFEGLIQGLGVVFCQNERPPQGLLGLLDWYFHGLISYSIRSGAVTGQPGECVYFPLTQGNAVYPIFVIGGGPASKPGLRTPPPAQSLSHLKKNMASLKLAKFAVSRADFGDMDSKALAKSLHGDSLWLTP